MVMESGLELLGVYDELKFVSHRKKAKVFLFVGRNYNVIFEQVYEVVRKFHLVRLLPMDK